MKIDGFLKTTLLDYPQKIAATIFFSGCNFLCPFCHNKDFVLQKNSQPSYSPKEILTYLEKRASLLDGVCISGGEPTLQKDLISFLEDIKQLGYLIKLDTNGSNPDVLIDLYQRNLIDYVAMDIKHTQEKYPMIVNNPHFQLEPILTSVEFLKSGNIPYEFRTTVISEFHKREDFDSIGQWLSGAKQYYLQAYKDSNQVISPGFHTPSKEEFLDYVTLLTPHIDTVKVRGIDL